MYGFQLIQNMTFTDADEESRGSKKKDKDGENHKGDCYHPSIYFLN